MPELFVLRVACAVRCVSLLWHGASHRAGERRDLDNARVYSEPSAPVAREGRRRCRCGTSCLDSLPSWRRVCCLIPGGNSTRRIHPHLQMAAWPVAEAFGARSRSGAQGRRAGLARPASVPRRVADGRQARRLDAVAHRRRYLARVHSRYARVSALLPQGVRRFLHHARAVAVTAGDGIRSGGAWVCCRT